MPAKGGNPALTDEQVMATVDWMLEQPQVSPAAYRLRRRLRAALSFPASRFASRVAGRQTPVTGCGDNARLSLRRIRHAWLPDPRAACRARFLPAAGLHDARPSRHDPAVAIGAVQGRDAQSPLARPAGDGRRRGDGAAGKRRRAGICRMRGDGDESTSDALWVDDPEGLADVKPGDRVRVTGHVAEQPAGRADPHRTAAGASPGAGGRHARRPACSPRHLPTGSATRACACASTCRCC